MLREIRQKNQKMIMPENFNNIRSKRGGPENQILILCQKALTRELKIRVVGFVLRKFLTYFAMLIVPHALQCVDVAF